MSKAILSFLTATLILACVVAVASDYSGSYVFNESGETITLVFEQDSGGVVRGSLDDGVSTLELTGRLEAPSIRGHASGADGTRLSFLATLDESGRVQLQLSPVDEAGNPVQELAQTLAFTPLGAGMEAEGGAKTATSTREVYINRVKLDSEFVLAVEAHYQTIIQDGRYWYDAACGAWGVEGGPTAGFLVAGLDLPGPMPADISGGGTGIFINGREVHVLDQQALHNVFGQTIPGHYWLDAQGNLGPEGGPAIANLAQAMQRARESVTHGYDSAGGARGTVAGGMYSGRTATGKSVFWFPGM